MTLVYSGDDADVEAAVDVLAMEAARGDARRELERAGIIGNPDATERAVRRQLERRKRLVLAALQKRYA